MVRVELAPAKVNLFLHVGPLEAGGYHPLASLVAFADVGDRLVLDPDGAPGLSLTGPFAKALEAEGGGNLVSRALAALARETGLRTEALSLTLDKRLPVAAGLGGGSSDAGAALRLARDVLAPDLDPAVLEAAARCIGADGPMCLRAVSAWAEGHGDMLTPEPRLPCLDAVLVNPGLPSPTGAVYGMFDTLPGVGSITRPVPPDDWRVLPVIDWLAVQRNDLEAAALALEPAIGVAMEALRAQGEARLVRMSGSGATVFALYDGPQAARRAARAVGQAHPGWWVCDTRLG